MKLLNAASTGPPTRRLLMRGLPVLGLLVVMLLAMAIAASANPGVIAVFDQWANKAPMHWINGDLNPQNSIWHEGDAVPQRIVYQTACGTQESFTVRYGTTKNGKHAFDYLTNYNFSESLTKADLCMNITGCDTWNTLSTAAMSHDPNLNGALPGGGTLTEQPTTGRVFTMYSPNGATFSAGTPTISSGTYADTSETDVLLTFTSNCAAGQTPGSTVPVLITFGAHVAREADWGVGSGAFNISGSPYHVMTINGGSRDNQMKAGAVIPPGGTPEIRICKQVVGPYTDGHLFNFTLHQTGAPTNFQLADQQCRTFAPVATGNWTIQETTVLDSLYKFSRVECDTVNASFTPSTTFYGGVITLNGSDSVAVCTFYNSNVTAVTLAGFTGKAAGGQVQLNWQTGTETNNAGFNVLRATSAAGPYVKVNTQLIGATGDAVAGASYSFLDKPGYGKFFYKLEDVDLSGNAKAHDAVDVTVAWPFLRLSRPPAPPAQ